MISRKNTLIRRIAQMRKCMLSVPRFLFRRCFLNVNPSVLEMGLDFHTVIDEVYISPTTTATTNQKKCPGQFVKKLSSNGKLKNYR